MVPHEIDGYGRHAAHRAGRSFWNDLVERYVGVAMLKIVIFGGTNIEAACLDAAKLAQHPLARSAAPGAWSHPPAVERVHENNEHPSAYLEL
ncbi:MAG: hypothetical protein M0R28_17835 [Pigmentiphaga sp.]|nr:hypothetical protein [Pigmentiphaga sp.]